MRKSTQQKIMVAFIIFTFSMSSLAYFFQPKDNTEGPKQLTSFLIDGELDAVTETAYVNNGFTSLKFFYNDTALVDYVNQLPDATSTNLNQIQLIVQKIPASETYVVVNSRRGQEELRNVTKSGIFSTLCIVLTIPPLECGLGNVTG